MSETYTTILTHVVFSTQGRRNLIPAELEPQLWDCIAVSARRLGMKALAVGGTADHIHILLSLPATVALATAVQQIKAATSKWLRERCQQTDFAWQEGYAAFSIGSDQVDATIVYINRQPEHHRERDSSSELAVFLKRNEWRDDRRSVWN